MADFNQERQNVNEQYNAAGDIYILARFLKLSSETEQLFREIYITEKEGGTPPSPNSARPHYYFLSRLTSTYESKQAQKMLEELINEGLVELQTIHGVPSKLDEPALNSGFVAGGVMLGLFGPLAALPGLLMGESMRRENIKSQLIEFPSILLTSKGKAIAQIKFGS